MKDKEIKVIGSKEYVILHGDFYTDGIIEANMKEGYSVTATSAAQGKPKSQMINLEKTGVPFHRGKNGSLIIDCNLVIMGSLTSYPIPLAERASIRD